jgi:hypothetical protein
MCLRFVFLLIMQVASWLRLSRRKEAWKTAEILILRHQVIRRAHLVPAANLPAVLAWQANGSEVDTVLVDGEVVVRHGRPTYLTTEEEQALYAGASARAATISQRAGIVADRPWRLVGR